jgi:peptidoglycan hydrolase CwlO-like protein
MIMMVEKPLIAWKISEWIFIRSMIFMNMEVSNEELKELLDKFMKRLDKMDKERDVMKKKLDRMNNHIKNVNKALDELYYSMDDGQEIEFNLTEEDLEHVKRISNLIQDNKVDFLDDEDFKVMIHSVVGES